MHIYHNKLPSACSAGKNQAGAGNQLAQGKPASTVPSSQHTCSQQETQLISNRWREQHRMCPAQKKMAPTDLPFSGAKPIIHSNKNTTSQITVNLKAANSPLEVNPFQVHYT